MDGKNLRGKIEFSEEGAPFKVRERERREGRRREGGREETYRKDMNLEGRWTLTRSSV